MAQVLVPYGVLGWLKLRPHSSQPEALLGYRRWWLRDSPGAAWREVVRAEAKMHSGTVLARLEGIDSREAALALRGAEVGVMREAMPVLRAGELYWADLVGLEVVNREGAVLGRVASVQEYGAHPVLRVAAEGEAAAERLIPFVAAHVDGVDVAAGRIDVDWQPDY